MNFFQELHEIDEDILLHIQDNFRTPKLDKIFRTITNLGDYGFIWLVITIIMLLNKKHKKTAFMMTLALSFGLMITNVLVKNAVQRARPFDLIKELLPLIPHPKDWSFPSGHATSSIACSIIMLRNLSKKFGISGLTLAILISISRVYLGVHYPSDVIAGGLIGTAVALTSEKIVNKIYEKDTDNKNPPN